MALFGVSGVALTTYFLSSDLSGPFHDNLVPELIGFCIEGFFLVGLLSLIQDARERARRRELWLSLRGSLRGWRPTPNPRRPGSWNRTWTAFPDSCANWRKVA